LNKIALGTAQFGLDYGVNNKQGRIPKREAFEILEFAASRGVKILDTAPAYGVSETVLGEFLGGRPNEFDVVSKLPAGAENVLALKESLKRLKIDALYGYLVHDFGSFRERPRLWNDLIRCRESGQVRKIGFSLYYPRDFDVLREMRIRPDLVQVPYNIFDQRFAVVFSALKEEGVEIHVRSTFLQGLLLKTADELDDRFIEVRPKVARLQALAADAGVPVSTLCLSFVLGNPSIDQVVVGVDNLDNLRQNLESAVRAENFRRLVPELEKFGENEERIILPFLWKSLKRP
jgi:aryl-alcohol dehydrogenase-like predicted oxidoreductase